MFLFNNAYKTEWVVYRVGAYWQHMLMCQRCEFFNDFYSLPPPLLNLASSHRDQINELILLGAIVLDEV